MFCKVVYLFIMKQLLFFLILFTTSLHSQDFSKVDVIVQSYHSIKSIDELSNRINYDFKTDYEKVRAVYNYINLNISYDYSKLNSELVKGPEQYFYYNEKDFQRRKNLKDDKIISETFSTKKALCYGFALVFKKTCDLLNIENEIIKGYVRLKPNEINKVITKKNHAWNAAKINNKWMLFDITFGNGLIEENVWKQKPDYFYFNIDKDLLKITHYPSSPFWISFFGQKKLNIFCNQPIYENAYFKSNSKLISPKLGELNINNNKLTFEFKNLDPSIKISYKVDNTLKKPKKTHYKDTTYLVLTIPNKSSKLTLYFNNNSALTYLITNK